MYPELPYCVDGVLSPYAIPDRKLYRSPGNITLSDIIGTEHILKAKGSMRIKASGWCMFPNIHNKDTLNVKETSVDALKIGDVVVFKAWDRFVCHRVIKKPSGTAKKFVLTRPDRAKSGNDGPLSEEEIIGRVDSVSRKGRVLRPDRRKYSLIEVIINRTILSAYEFKKTAEKRFLDVLNSLQGQRSFRSMARSFFFDLRRSRLDFIISIPTQSGIAARL